jgi:N,N'-diacetyllegionaminate synthase
MEKRKKFRRSLVARHALNRGHVVTESDFDAKRPGTGIAPDEIRHVTGRTLACDLALDQVLHWSDLL